MSFIAVILSLLLDRTLRHLQFLRGPRWFHAYIESLGFFAHSRGFWHATAGVLVIVLVPTVVVLFLGHLLDHIWGVFGFAYAVLILLVTLGPQDLHAQADDYIEAVQSGNASRANELARELLGTEPPPEDAACSEAITRAVLCEANDRLFGILFWFAVLGPAGAVLYRSADFLHRLPAEAGHSHEFTAAVARLYGVLAWIPAHLVAIGYAFAGSFEEAVSDIKGYYANCTLRFFQVNNDVLTCTGLGALHSSAAEAGTVRVRSALMLVWRTLVIWLVVYGLTALFGWTW